uniref:Macaca fascicularis brain cDNA clone: QorA-12550, similar to human hypothetical protein FLJ10560 (FLJ10560), mRNA, RefSeq: NM_018138.1 n=1 Tax=Macaca fascicularis TaxID=9541 RepID=I7GHJ1_MACFA|nr:unnamed protein product [Macaca fascicularis]
MCKSGPQKELTRASTGQHGGTSLVGSCSWPRTWRGFTSKYLIVFQ